MPARKLPQPAPPADPHYPPPEPIAPIVHRQFEQDGRPVTILRHREITCCGVITDDPYYTAVVGPWTLGYSYQFSQHATRPRRTTNWRTATSSASGDGEMLHHTSLRGAVRDARRRVHEIHLTRTYFERAKEVQGAVEAGTSLGPKLDTVVAGQVVVAEWGPSLRFVVVAEVDGDGRPTYVLVYHPMNPQPARLVGARYVRALYAPPGA